MTYTVGYELLDSGEKNYIETCPVLDGYEVVSASKLEKMFRIFRRYFELK